MSDDLIEAARHIIEGGGPYDVTLSKKQANALLARIGELESACYRLTEERDRLKGWADKYHDEVLELRTRLATAEADAMEMWKALKPFADQAEVFAAADDALSFPDSFRVAIAGHTVGDLRHARVICNYLKPKGQE